MGSPEMTLETGGRVEGLAVCRVVEALGARALRIVDLQINPEYISRIGRCVEELISRNDCEYADILQVGLPVEEFSKAGFQLLDHDGSTVIPNYFEPFLSKNVKVDVCYKCASGDNFIAFKGDGDQDRPNVLRAGGLSLDQTEVTGTTVATVRTGHE